MNLNDQQLVVAAFEGALDERGFRQLQERLRKEPALLAFYREQALLHHSLSEEFEGRDMIGQSVPAVTMVPRWVPVFAAFAAALVLGFAGWSWLRSPRATPLMAACDFSADAVATVDGRPAMDGSGFAQGSRLSVERGWVRLNLPGKAVALVEAPASLVYEADQVLRLENGRARFHSPENAKGFTVKATALTATDQGTEFGVLSRPGGNDELHVFDGEVSVAAVTGEANALLKTREAAAIGSDGILLRMPAREEDFKSLNPENRVLLEDRFDGGPPLLDRKPVHGASHWRLEKGSPQIKGGHLVGSSFEAFFTLPADGLSASRPVLLVTVETVSADGSPFHTAGWSGFSLYQDGYEICFFGDSYGPEETWSLDVKRRLAPVLPNPLVTGPRVMTLRYDRRDGTVELHEGQAAGENPIARSKLLPGLTFDQIRIGASEEASLALSKLSVRAVHETPRR